MNPGEYITASSLISKQKIYKNGSPVFRSNKAGLSDFLDEAYQFVHIQYPKFHKMDNLSKLGLLAVEILLKDEISVAMDSPEDTGIVLANTSASLDSDRKYYETMKEIPSPALFVYTLPNIVIGEICIKYHFKGENAFFVFKQFDATFIQQYVSNLFKNQLVKVCICGWIELLAEEYKVVLFLVEVEKRVKSVPFTVEYIRDIFVNKIQ